MSIRCLVAFTLFVTISAESASADVIASWHFNDDNRDDSTIEADLRSAGHLFPRARRT